MSDSIDGAASEPVFELGFIPREQFHQRHIIQAVPYREIRLAGGLRKAVPRARQLTVVAAVDPVADQRAQIYRDTALEFDGEIGNTAASIQPARRDDRLSRAPPHASVG